MAEDQKLNADSACIGDTAESATTDHAPVMSGTPANSQLCTAPRTPDNSTLTSADSAVAASDLTIPDIPGASDSEAAATDPASLVDSAEIPAPDGETPAVVPPAKATSRLRLSRRQAAGVLIGGLALFVWLSDDDAAVVQDSAAEQSALLSEMLQLVNDFDDNSEATDRPAAPSISTGGHSTDLLSANQSSSDVDLRFGASAEGDSLTPDNSGGRGLVIPLQTGTASSDQAQQSSWQTADLAKVHSVPPSSRTSVTSSLQTKPAAESRIRLSGRIRPLP